MLPAVAAPSDPPVGDCEAVGDATAAAAAAAASEASEDKEEEEAGRGGTGTDADTQEDSEDDNDDGSDPDSDDVDAAAATTPPETAAAAVEEAGSRAPGFSRRFVQQGRRNAGQSTVRRGGIGRKLSVVRTPRLPALF